MKEIRKEIANLYKAQEVLRDNIKKKINEYLIKAEGQRKIYVSDHALRRYCQRVLGIDVADDCDVRDLPIPAENIRKLILTEEDEIKILRNQISLYNKGKYIVVLSGITVKTILLPEENENKKNQKD